VKRNDEEKFRDISKSKEKKRLPVMVPAVVQAQLVAAAAVHRLLTE
jgi:hypothetical protein